MVVSSVLNLCTCRVIGAKNGRNHLISVNIGSLPVIPVAKRRGMNDANHQSGGNMMDKALYDRGMAMRRKVLGDEYVDRAVANTDDFNRQFQELLTTYCWGAVWGDDALKPRERSIL